MKDIQIILAVDFDMEDDAPVQLFEKTAPNRTEDMGKCLDGFALPTNYR